MKRIDRRYRENSPWYLPSVGNFGTIERMPKRKKSNKASTASLRRPSRAPISILLLVVFLFAIIRVRMRNIPLERDEGEYAYAGQLLLQRIPPYKLAFNMKLPGTYMAYALMMAIFGQTTPGIHMGLLVVNAATIVLIFFLTRRLLDPLAAIVAAASYALLSASPSVLGFAGHATHFVVLPSMAGLLVLMLAIETQQVRTFALSGLLLGLAFLMKQPGIFFIFFALLYFIVMEARTRADWRNFVVRLAAFGCGAVFPFLLTCLWLWKAGVFGRFWFWTFTYGRLYGTMTSLRDAPAIFWHAARFIIGPAFAIWIIAGVGLIALWWNRKSSSTLFVAGLLFFSFMAVCPGFYFRWHYFIVMLPVVSILAGAAISTTTQKLRDRQNSGLLAFTPVVLFLAAFGYAFSQRWEFWFELDPISASRSVYGPNPFPEAVQIADFIKAHSTPSQTIAIIGSEPEIYFYSQRHSATGYIYTYPLMEEQKYALNMQQEMISDIEKAHPEFLVMVGVPTSWLSKAGSQRLIFDWAQKYVADHYDIAGIVDILDESQYRWDEDAKNYQAISPYQVQIFKLTQL